MTDGSTSRWLPRLAGCALLLVLALASACGDDGGGGSGGPGITGVMQGGAQDFGAFRALLDSGEIPGPGSLDSVGFFNEHKIELPEPDCGQRVCLHGLLGTMGNMITGSGCTMLVIGLNTALDPDDIERPPLNLTLAIDTSGSMAGQPIERVREGLLRMLDALEPEDRISIVTFDDHADVLADAQPADALMSPINRLRAQGATNLYDGLRTAFDLATAELDPARQNRVVLLSDGEPTVGLQERERLLNLTRAYAEQGIGLSAIGVGSEFDPELLRSLAETGAGTFYFIDDLAAVREVFSEEVGLTLVPLAQRAQIELEVGSGYSLRALYGARNFSIAAGTGAIYMPTLHLAHRQSASDDMLGRRGGGGVLLAELITTGEDPTDVGSLSLAYDDPTSGKRVSQEVDVESPVDPEDALDDGYFGGPGVEKAFVALNVYAGFVIATEAAAGGDYGTGLVTLEALGQSIERWLKDNPDPDIEDDLDSLERLTHLLQRQAQAVRPIEPPEPWPAD